jgi:acetyl-CoA carboxylase alpha subunit
MAARMKMYLVKCLKELVGQKPETLVDNRYGKYRQMGVFLEAAMAEGTSE